ncbi:MFS transporter [Henriciella sp. AS95]|uniref:MFS transporter n=1 Tax=Henriciella sp. AS95 TaxID=3135782 RepID=UPI00316DEE18
MPASISGPVGLERPQSAALAWSAVAVLCTLYVISFVDRMILALLVDPVTQDLGISDTQIGLLIGIGFALVYVLIGLPLAHFVDAGARRLVLVGGATLWSVATIGSGFAESFSQLAIGRLGVAVGEAALTPVAIAVIADMFPKAQRALPTSIYMAVGILMGSGSFFIGGLAVDAATHLSAAISMDVWRTTLIIVGTPGLFLALIAAFLIGPPSRAVQNEGAVPIATAQQVLSYLLHEGRFFVLMFLSVGTLAALAMGLLSWAPTLLVRTYSFGLSEAGIALGSVGVPAGIVGTVCGPLIVRRLATGLGGSNTPFVIGIAALLAGASLSFGLMSGQTVLFLISLGVTYMFLSAAMVMPAIVIQEASPPAMRARLMATHLLSLGLLGQGLGPVVVARLSDQIGGTQSLSNAIVLTAIGATIMAMIFAWFMHRRIDQTKAA